MDDNEAQTQTASTNEAPADGPNPSPTVGDADTNGVGDNVGAPGEGSADPGPDAAQGDDVQQDVDGTAAAPVADADGGAQPQLSPEPESPLVVSTEAPTSEPGPTSTDGSADPTEASADTGAPSSSSSEPAVVETLPDHPIARLLTDLSAAVRYHVDVLPKELARLVADAEDAAASIRRGEWV